MTETKNIAGVAGERLKSFIDRIERLTVEKEALQEDIKEIYSEATGVGFDAKVIKKIVKLRKISKEKRLEEEEILDVYLTAIGEK